MKDAISDRDPWGGLRALRFAVSLARASVIALSFALPSAHAQQPPTRHETIVVTGVFEPVPLEEADRPVTLVDAKSLELLVNSPVDFLRLEPSVDLRERGINGTQADVSIRGGTFGQTLVLLDGFRMNDAQTGHHNMDLPVPLQAISRVEILRGSGSTLYGSDAVGGVINFVTKPPDFTEIRVRTAVGNFGVNQQSGSIDFAAGKFAEQLDFSRDFSSGFIPDRDYRNLAFLSSTTFSTAWGPTRILLAHNDRPFGADQFYGNFNSWERTRTWFAGVHQALGSATEFSLAFRRHTDLFVLFRDHPEIYTNHHALESFQAALRRRERLAENARLFYGVEGFRDAIVSNNLGIHTRGRGAAYLAFDARAWKRLSFQAGAREEIYQSGRGQFSPTLSAGFWLNSRLKLRAGAARAFRVPSLTDLYYHDPANVGSPNLRPENAWTTEAGIDAQLGKRIHGEVTIFQRDERDVIDYVRTSPSSIWQATNIQQLRSRGLEASVGAPLGRLQELELRYTGLRGFREPIPGVESRYAFSFPVNSGVIDWRTTLPYGLIGRSRVGILERYGQNTYALWDFYFARAKGRIHPFIQFSNLTNTSYEEISGVVMPGRSIVAGVEIIAWSRKK